MTPEQLRGQLGTRTGSRPFKEALGRPGLSVIAEFKRVFTQADMAALGGSWSWLAGVSGQAME